VEIERVPLKGYNASVELRELGERGLIRLMREMVAAATPPESLVVGIGDDAAAWRSGTGLLLATTDTLVEGVHFLPGSPQALGWKALAANLSDIAAMGGQPRLALVSLALPPSTEVAWVEGLYQGLLEAAKGFGVTLAGGDTVDAPLKVITLLLLGEASSEERLMRRSAARAGELLAVTGYLGNSAGGLRVLRGEAQPGPESAAFLREAHLQPQPRISEGQALTDLGVRAAIDVSDGLLADAERLCLESGVAAELDLERLPIHPYLKEAFPAEYHHLALSGGEDYELLFSAPPDLLERVARALATQVTTLGRLVEGPPGQVKVFDREGKPLEFTVKGWEHFREGL
jgi:thiamine-monophosphate kinase